MNIIHSYLAKCNELHEYYRKGLITESERDLLIDCEKERAEITFNVVGPEGEVLA